MTMDMPKNVDTAINLLQSAGFEAYAVGGCVRDSLLGKIPNDWDITTSAKPEDMKSVFIKSLLLFFLIDDKISNVNNKVTSAIV